MKKHTIQKMLTAALAATLVAVSVSSPVAAAEKNSFSLTKISNPFNGTREIDGLVNGGDRETSYAWCMAARGDYIYIGTNKNIGGMVVNNVINSLSALGISEDMTWAITDVISNGEIPHPSTDEGGQILRCNCITNEIEVIYTAPVGTSFRIAITHGDKVYFGSYAAGNVSEKNQNNEILCIDEKNHVQKVFSANEGTSLRAACEMNGRLYLGGVDSSETLESGAENCAKLAVLTMDNNDNTKWNRVADYRDFGILYAADSMMFSPVTSPVWDICSYKGDIYATIPNSKGFAVFRGHPAKDGEQANEYGWNWSEVVGLKNGINPAGMNSDTSAESEKLVSILATPVVFNDRLYLFDFDNTVAAELNAFSGLMQQLAGKDIKPSQYLRSVYTTLRHPQSLWELNDATGKFEKVEGFSKLMQNTTNEYVWRAEVHNNELYLTTMDSATIYDYITKLTNGSFLKKTPQELLEQLGYIKDLILQIKPDFSEKAQQAKQQLMNVVNKFNELIAELQNNENVEAFIEKYSSLIAQAADAVSVINQEMVLDRIAAQLAESVVTSGAYAVQQLSELEHQIRECLDSANIAKLLAPDLDVPVSTLSEEEYNQLVQQFKLRVNGLVEKLKVTLPEADIDVNTVNAIVAGFTDFISEEAVSNTFMNNYEKIKSYIPEELNQQIEVLLTIDPQAAADLIKEKSGELKENIPENLQMTFLLISCFDAEAVREVSKNLVEEATSDAKQKLIGMIFKTISEMPAELIDYIGELFSGLPEEQQGEIADAISNAILAIDEYQPDFVNDMIDKFVDDNADVFPIDIQAFIDQYAEEYTNAVAEKTAQAIATLQSMDIPVPDDVAQQILDKLNSELNDFRNAVADTLESMGVDDNTTIGDIVKASVNSDIKELEDTINSVYRFVKSSYESIDWDAFGMYIYISDMVRENTWGFDMIKTSDGVNFETVTDDGFGDRYNYGGRSLVSTPYGLYIGTANPFYGAQLFRLTNSSNPDDNKENSGSSKPNDNEKSNADNSNKGNNPNTSDSTSVFGMLLTGISAAGIAALSLGRKKKNTD